MSAEQGILADPTETTYEELRAAYRHFNQSLFGGTLPDCLITLQRKKRTYGYFSKARFVAEGGETTDEIALNPTYFEARGVVEVMQTLVHEMAHLWQFHFGKPGRARYHNHEWAAKMEEVGLMPSNTGEPGGSKTGDQMMDYPIEGGRFSKALESLLGKGFKVTWRDRVAEKPDKIVVPNDGEGGEEEENPKPENKSNRLKYSCPDCGINVWGKPELNVICGDCNSKLTCSEALEPD